MGFRNEGPNVSQNPQAVSPGAGQFTAEDHSFESIVFQQGRVPCDWEMNLLQEALGTYGFRRHFHRLLPSCWLTGAFLETGASTPALTFLAADTIASSTANKFQVAGADVIVNGWMLRFDLTESVTLGLNQITLPAPPVSGTRTDFVILEIWRQLIAPAPSSIGKSASGQIFRFGNVKTPDGPPLGNQNLVDDILEPTLSAETSRRVQIQYRYRVIQGLQNLTNTPDGFEDSNVFAFTVPFQSGSGLDGTTTTYGYVKSSIDPGLWIAGNGDQPSATALGTMDGNMFAIPMFAVFRRNTSGFNRATNLNGGALMATTVSGRPDGLYADQVVSGDVKDLRKSVAWDLTEVRDKAFQQLLSNNLASEHEITQNAAEIPFLGPGGTSFIVRDNIGTSSHLGNSDAVRINFSDRNVTESIVCRVPIGAGGASSVVLSLGSLPVWWNSSPVNLLTVSPSGTNIFSVGQVRMVNVAGTADTDMNANPSPPTYVKFVQYTTAIGPGVDTVTLTFNTSVASVDIFIELLIEYPIGFGTRRNILSANQVWTPPALNMAGWVDSSTLTATSDAQRYSLASSLWWMDVGHRELSLRLKTIAQAKTFYAADTTTIYIPESLTGTVTINDGFNAPYSTSSYTVNTSYTKVTLTFARPAGTAIATIYIALRPAPPVSAIPGDSYQVFYQSRAIQTIPVPAGIQTLQLLTRSISQNLHIMTSGSGSPDSPLNFSSPSTQIPNGLLPAASYPEARLDTPNQVAITGFNSTTGYMQLPVLVPYLPDPQQVQLYRDAPDTVIDGDNRNFWPKSNAPSPVVYTPSAYGPALTFKQKHKVALPVLMELKADFPSIGRKGTMVMVVFSRWIEYDDQNSIIFNPTVGDTCAGVYRVRGNMLNPKRVAT